MFKLNSLSFNAKLAICFALPTSALLVYLLWKQNKDSEDDTNIEHTIMSRQCVIEVKVPHDCVGSIIGSEGSTIKGIQKSTGARINFKDKDKDKDSEEDRIMVIRGSNVNAQKAELEIKRMIADKPLTLTEDINVPNSCLGRLIGKQGTNIKLLCKSSGSKIVIAKDPLKENKELRKVTLTGSIEQILSAKTMIDEKIKEEMEFKKRRNRSRSFQKSYNNGFDSILKETYTTKKPVPLQYPHTNNEISVFVSSVANPYVFWIQIIDSDACKFDKLVNDMTEFYDEKASDPSLLVDDFTVGNMVAAKFNGNQWLRAEIKGTLNPSKDENKEPASSDDNNNEEDVVDLYSIDFGSSSYAKKSDLRKLPTAFADLPGQAVECSLNGIKKLDKVSPWKEEAITFFEDITYCYQWTQLRAKLVRFYENSRGENVPIIDLRDPEKDLVIAKLMIDNEFAIADVDVADTKDNGGAGDSAIEESVDVVDDDLITQKF